MPSVGGRPVVATDPCERSWVEVTGQPVSSVGGDWRRRCIISSISDRSSTRIDSCEVACRPSRRASSSRRPTRVVPAAFARSEEHTSELQSRGHIVCRLLLAKKRNIYTAGKHFH